MRFIEKLQTAIDRQESLLCVGLDPDPELLVEPDSEPSPDRLKKLAWDWLQRVIDQSHPFVCAYKLNLGFYHALGIPGLELLEQTLHAIPPAIPTILDAKYSDLSSSTIAAHQFFETWQVDAVTVSALAGQDLIASFLVYSGKAVFVVCTTANTSAQAIQDYPSGDLPFYLHCVQQAQLWGAPEELALKVGTTSPETLKRIRSIAPERFILATRVEALSLSQSHSPIAASQPDLGEYLSAGLDPNGSGLILSVPPTLLTEADPKPVLSQLREEVNQIRSRQIQTHPSCEVWFPNVCPLNPQPHQDLILQLFDIGCILFGDYVQASGATFSYYIDLRKIISQPQIFHQILSTYAELITPLPFDRIAGIPYGSLPIATGLALRLNYPMVFPRKEAKLHGTKRLVEGNFHPGEKIVVIDDILISGKSAIEGAQKLQSTGLIVEDIVVFIDHEKGVKDRLKQQGYTAHSVITITQIAETLYQSDRINQEQFQAMIHA